MSTEEERRAAVTAVVEDPVQARRRSLVESVLREPRALSLKERARILWRAQQQEIPGYRAAFEEPWTTKPGVVGGAVRGVQATAKALAPETVGSAGLMVAAGKPLQLGAQAIAKYVPKIPGLRWTGKPVSSLWDWFMQPLPAGPRPAPSPAPAAPAPTPTRPAPPAVPGAVSQAVETMRTGMDDVLRVVAPAMRGPVAEYTALALRHALGKLARDTEMAQTTLDQAVTHFDALPKDVTRAFLFHMEQPGAVPLIDRAQQDFAMAMRGLFHQREQALASRGILHRFVQDYFPHIWKDPERANNVLAEIYGKRPLLGPGHFRHQRTIPLIQQGIAMGLEPVDDNPARLALMKLFEEDRYIRLHDFLTELKQGKLLRFVPAERRAPAGWKTVDDKAFTVLGAPLVTHRGGYDAVVMDQLIAFGKSLGIDVETKLHPRGGFDVWGYTSPVMSSVVRRFGGPESVVSHELGHQLDFRYGLANQLVKDPILNKELRALADLRMEGTDPRTVSAYFRRYIRTKEEKIANLVHAYVHLKDRMRLVAPNLYQWFDHFISTHREMLPLARIQPSLRLGTEATQERLKGILVKGQWYAPEPAAQVVNNYLSPTFMGKAAFDMTRGMFNSLNMAQLGISGFHFTFVSLDTMASSVSLGLQRLVNLGQMAPAMRQLGAALVAPIRAWRLGKQLEREYQTPGAVPTMKEIANALALGGQPIRMDAFHQFRHNAQQWASLMRQGRHGEAAVWLAPAILDAISYPLMRVYVPRLKLGVFAELARYELERLGPQASLAEKRRAMARAADAVDNRLGQLTYQNLFQTRHFKELMMLAVRAYGWGLGALRIPVGAGVDIARQLRGPQPLGETRFPSQTVSQLEDLARAKAQPELTPNMAYLLGLTMTTATMGWAMHYLLTGEFPSDLKSYFFPGHKGRELSFPTYLTRDIRGWYLHPVQEAKNKMNPGLHLVGDMLENEDFYGAAIYNEDDPLVKKAMDAVDFVIADYKPFSLRQARRQLMFGESRLTAAASFFGLLPAPWQIRDPEAFEEFMRKKRLPALKKKLRREQEPSTYELLTR